MLWWTLRQLRSKDAKTREKAAQKLGELRDPRAVEPLVAALVREILRVHDATRGRLLRADIDLFECRAAMRAAVQASPTRLLGFMDSAHVDPAIRIAAAMKADRVRAACTFAAALKIHGWRARSAVEQALDLIEPNWAKSEAARRAVPDLVWALGGFARKLVDSSVGGLIEGSGEAAEPVVAAFKEVTADIAQAAARLLAKIGDVRAVDALVAAHVDRRSDVREAAAEALKLLGRQAPVVAEPATAEAAPRAPIRLDVNNPACTLCGKALGGGESIVAGARVVIGSRPADELHDDYTLFRGSVCFNCRAVLCTDCLGKRLDQCPTCKGGTKPAYRHYLRELAAL